MSHYMVIYSKKDNGWIAKKRNRSYNYVRIPNSPSHDNIEECEEWIRDNYKSKYKYDKPWIDHTIERSCGHLMGILDWIECCDTGGFIDYDGNGSLVDENYEFLDCWSVKPSDYTENGVSIIPKEAKYILWFNR